MCQQFAIPEGRITGMQVDRLVALSVEHVRKTGENIVRVCEGQWPISWRVQRVQINELPVCRPTQMGLVKKDRYDRMLSRKQRVESAIQALDKKKLSGKSLASLYVTQEADENKIRSLAPEIFSLLRPYDDITVFADIKYRGYMDKELERIRKMAGIDERAIPENTDYALISALRVEARQKFAKIKPLTLGQARNIPGISPADIQVLSVALEKRRRAG